MKNRKWDDLISNLVPNGYTHLFSGFKSLFMPNYLKL